MGYGGGGDGKGHKHITKIPSLTQDKKEGGGGRRKGRNGRFGFSFNKNEWKIKVHPPPPKKSFSKSSFIDNNIKTASFRDCCKSCCTAFNPGGKATLPHPNSLFQHMPLPSPQIGYKQTPCTLPPAPKRQFLPPEESSEGPRPAPWVFSLFKVEGKLLANADPQLNSGLRMCQPPAQAGWGCGAPPESEIG